jgi:mannose-6-phosphate isomerase-like protein (cupin superfamily)
MQQLAVTQLASGEGRAVHMSGDTYTFKAVGETSDGMLTLFESLIPPGGGPPPHIHHREIEYYYLLDGELEIMDGDRTFMARAGAVITIPKGALHRFTNVGTDTARMLILFTPGGIEGLFFAVGLPATPGTSPSPPDEAERERFRTIGPQYALEVPPPQP